jgi:hypothetical protein
MTGMPASPRARTTFNPPRRMTGTIDC